MIEQFGFLGTLGEGKCWAEEEAKSMTVRFIGPEIVPGNDPKIDCWIENLYVGGRKIPQDDPPISTKPYKKEIVQKLTYNDPSGQVSGFSIGMGFASKDSDGIRPGAISSSQFPAPRPGSEVIINYDVIRGKIIFAGSMHDQYIIDIKSIVQTYITLDKELKHVEVKESAPIRAAMDSPQVKKEEYTVKYSVVIQRGYKVEGELKANLFLVELGIKGAIERQTSRTYEESKTTTREVTIPGNGKPYKVVWIETYRTGKAVTIINGKKHEVPFEFRDGWDLQTKEVKD